MSQAHPPEPGDPGSPQDMLNAVGTPGELRQLLNAEGVDDKVIEQFVAGIGVDPVLDRIFGLMGTRLVPGKAGGDGGVVQWEIKTPEDGRTYQLVIADGRAKGRRGAPDKPRVTLRMSLPNLLRLCAGELNGVTAVMTGKIKISGDMMFAAKMQSWFDYS
ncbi:SCP2 sterol-binding domain-containing protein [Actinomadura kijaniata]|uniref:SCP2 sterol-binding domain-containing protein n=1 Tax=Actinomadura kijaniata TaxID=46161 RepID=UPI00082C75AA|nr:SCP2 sterol-binding domain-containing protein [Actinomadura kijaniata]